MTRNLQNLQAYMILSEIGLWSGNSRKMEIAESFVQPLVVVSNFSCGGRNGHPLIRPDSATEWQISPIQLFGLSSVFRRLRRGSRGEMAILGEARVFFKVSAKTFAMDLH